MKILSIFITTFSSCILSTTPATQPSFTLHAPYILSEQAIDAITIFLHTHSACDRTTLLTNVTQQFPWISSITYTSINPARSTYTITIEEPFCALSNGYYVTCNGTLFPQELLKEEVYKKLPLVHFENCTQCSLSFGKQLCLLDRTLFDRYTIIWNDATNIILLDRQTECFPIITSLTKKITSQIAHYCHYIHKKITESYTKKKKTKYALDIRFDKQIVLRPQEDIKYEKSFSS